MGISGLLPLLKDVQVKKHISAFKGQSLAVDGYVWLHKGAFGCAEDLVTGSKTTKFVDYTMYRIRMLRHHGVSPLMVFDGGPLPAKKGTEVDRAARRATHLARAQVLTAQGRHKEARDHYTKCVDITPELALQLIKALKAEQVPYIVAPYEADAQLAFLEREGIVDGVITEDSDLLVFGCRNVIYKLDGDGECINIVRDDFPMCREFSFAGWGETEFRRMAILAGCDYLDSIPGIGIKTAHKLLRKHKTIEKVVQNVRLDGSLTVPSDYIPQFRLAELVFLHQRVYDPRSKRLTMLFNGREGRLEELEEGYIGPDMDPGLAQGIAEGRIHPETKEALEDLWPDFRPGKTALQPTTSAQGKNTLKTSKKINVSSGPLDAFIKRLPVKTEGPIRRAVLPTPVGVRGCGPARLSDLSVSKKQAAELAQCQAYEKENEIVLLDHDEASRGSKFFPPSKNRRQPGTPSSTGDIIITFENQSSLGDDLTEPSLKKEVPDTDDLPAMTSPSAACSTFMSPVKSSQHGSHFSSPGRDSDVSQGDEFDSQTFGSPVRTSTKQVEPNIRKRSAFSPAPVAKKRRLTTSPPRAELLLAINSSPEKPDAADNRIDLRKICHIDGSSSIHEDWEDEVENERPKIEPRDIETPESIKAKMVAKGLRAKYAFTPKTVTHFRGKPPMARNFTTPLPPRPMFGDVRSRSGPLRSLERHAPAHSPAAQAFSNATAAFGRTSGTLKKNKATTNMNDIDLVILDGDSDEDPANETIVDATPTKPLGRTLSGSEKLLAYRYGQ